MKERRESTVGYEDEKLFRVFELHGVLVDYLVDAIQEQEENRTFTVLTVVERLRCCRRVVLLFVVVRLVALNQIKDTRIFIEISFLHPTTPLPGGSQNNKKVLVDPI